METKVDTGDSLSGGTSLERRTGADLVDALSGHRLDRRRLLIQGSATGIAATAAGLGVAPSRAQDATPPPATPADDTASHDRAGMAVGTPTTKASRCSFRITPPSSRPPRPG